MNTLVRFSENDSGRDFFVGDLHGCYDVLKAELARVEFDCKRDRLFSVGDLVDHGPDSIKCLALVHEPWFHAVRGNHEMLMSDAMNGRGDMELWEINGGRWRRGFDHNELRMIVNNALRQMPLAIEVESSGKRIGVIHADVTSGRWGEFHELRDVWSRDRFNSLDGGAMIEGIDRVVVGHTIRPGVELHGNVLHIDTGAFTGRSLTLLSADEVLK